MKMLRRALAIACVGLVAAAAIAHAQITVGAITGTVIDSSGGVLPGVTLSLSGERLIGGVQTQITNTDGTYRFDRLPPGTYRLKAELQGFKGVERDDIRISASFIATVNLRLDVGQMSETVTVTGASPTVDLKSNVQQTVMGQDLLEGVPNGRDPWSLAKLIPGVQVSTYDVGGTQSVQSSALAAHGSSTNDVSYNIDGATVNWPGSGGGATMLYYDQGMFEEVNFQTSAIPAEQMVGGISINMVTKESGNKWRGNAQFSYANQNLQSDNWSNDPTLKKWAFTGNPTTLLSDFNLGGGGAIVRDRVWVNGSLRLWQVNRLVAQLNPNGTRASDPNHLKNFSGKVVWSVSTSQKLSVSYNYDNKIRSNRRNSLNQYTDALPGSALTSDAASSLQSNPASSTQVKYTGAIGSKAVFASSFSLMSGETDYEYQPGTEHAVRAIDTALNTASNAAFMREELPNSRLQFDNSVSYLATGWGGDHLLKAGVQFSRLRMFDQFFINSDMWLVYANGVPTSIYEFNTPTASLSVDKIFGIYIQDAWTIGKRLTLNLGLRFDNNRGTIPAQSNPVGTFNPGRSLPESQPINQSIAVWRSGLAYDVFGNGQTAIKASYSRYASQVGIDRVQNVHPGQLTWSSCPWSDLNGNGLAEPNEVGACSGFPGASVHYAGANGPQWPNSDEITAGVEHSLGRDVRVSAMYYHRTNHNQIGTRNLAAPTSGYTPVTVTIPSGSSGPGGTATFYNLNPAYLGLQNNVIDNEPYLDTKYNGVEFTASKRFSHRWQMLAGITIGKNTGGINNVNGQSVTFDLNDPNNTAYPTGIIGNDSKVAFRLAGSYLAPGKIMVSGSLIANGGFPYVATYTVTRSIYPALTRANQLVFLSDRGDTKLPGVAMLDLRLSRSFRAAGVEVAPQVDLYNITNASTITSYTTSTGSKYLAPSGILSPRIIRVGLKVAF
jgi:hypothetical protein